MKCGLCERKCWGSPSLFHSRGGGFPHEQLHQEAKINYGIGMNRPVFDDAAIAFTEGFYDTLGAGELIERAFEVGKNAVLEMASSSNAQSRKLIPVNEDDNPLKIQNQKHLIPVLKKNPHPTPIKPNCFTID